MIDKNIFDKTRNFHGVKGLVFFGEKIIVYRRDTKTSIFPLYIDLPGGAKEGNESPFDTFKREVKEEFGIDIDKRDIKYSRQYMSTIDMTMESYFIVTKSLGFKEEDIIFGNEGLEFSLISLDEFINLPDGIKRQQNKASDYLKTLKQKTA